VSLRPRLAFDLGHAQLWWTIWNFVAEGREQAAPFGVEERLERPRWVVPFAPSAGA
jgi:hypothetical protein